MVNTTTAYELLTNGSFIQAGFEAYKVSMGDWLWPVFFIFTLVVVFIKTESPGYLLTFAILGNALLSTRLTSVTAPIFYMTLVISLALVLYKFYMGRRIDQ